MTAQETVAAMFNATIRADVLKQIVDALEAHVPEAKFVVGPEGIQVRAVDPAHVCLVQLDLPPEAFLKYEATENELGIDLARLDSALKLAGSDDEVSLVLADGKLTVSFGNLEHKLGLVDTSYLQDPKVPSLALPAKVRVPSDELARGVRAASLVTDHVALKAAQDSFHIEARGETDQVTLSIDKDQLVDLSVEEDARSVYSTSYLQPMVKASKGPNVVTLWLGNDYPLKMEVPVADGTGKITFLLAPRIENPI